MEDHGADVIRPLIAARGELAKLDGYEAVDRDFINLPGYQRTLATYHLLDSNTRAMLEGFAAGVNFYQQQHPNKFPQYQAWTFSGHDVAAVSVQVHTATSAGSFVGRLRRERAQRDSLINLEEGGSNAWAFGPEKSKSGNAMLLRNPHLSWTAGYYEAHLTVPGLLNFYGDFRIGGLFGIIGGFNDRLGWATTNNYPDRDEFYALTADPKQPDHYLIDGTSIPLDRQLLTVSYKNGEALALEKREFLSTPYGPVIDRGDGKIYVLKRSGNREYRRGQQFMRMMLSQNLEDWKTAMQMQAITSSNYTYADADGNIFYIWNASLPLRPHPLGGDTVAIEVSRSHQIWQHLIPFEDIPQLHNPKGGYLHNENDPFHYTNLNEVITPQKYANHYPNPRLRSRSQHSLELVHNKQKLSLEDMVALKHSMRAVLADHVKPALIKAVRNADPTEEEKSALQHLQAWDNRVAAESRGGVLFQEWFVQYATEMRDNEFFAIPWDSEKPLKTPRGLADTEQAVEAFRRAIETLTEKYGTWDLAWGEVHRIRHGNLDLPASGGPGGLGCFRVLGFMEDEDGKQKVQRGDGWQLAIEFSDPPRAYSILAYGQSDHPDSPHHADQVQLFAESKMKKVAFTEADIQQDLIKRYRPGEE